MFLQEPFDTPAFYKLYKGWCIGGWTGHPRTKSLRVIYSFTVTNR